MGVDSVSIEFVVVRVLSAQAHICPRPEGGFTATERDVSDLGDKTVAVRVAGGVWRLAAVESRVQKWIRRSPCVEVLAGQDDPVVAAVGKRRVCP